MLQIPSADTANKRVLIISLEQPKIPNRKSGNTNNKNEDQKLEKKTELNE